MNKKKLRLRCVELAVEAKKTARPSNDELYFLDELKIAEAFESFILGKPIDFEHLHPPGKEQV
jgi:hypothetical protein